MGDVDLLRLARHFGQTLAIKLPSVVESLQPAEGQSAVEITDPTSVAAASTVAVRRCVVTLEVLDVTGKHLTVLAEILSTSWNDLRLSQLRLTALQHARQIKRDYERFVAGLQGDRDVIRMALVYPRKPHPTRVARLLEVFRPYRVDVIWYEDIAGSERVEVQQQPDTQPDRRSLSPPPIVDPW